MYVYVNLTMAFGSSERGARPSINISCRMQKARSVRNLTYSMHHYTSAYGKGLECYQPFWDLFLSLFANGGINFLCTSSV